MDSHIKDSSYRVRVPWIDIYRYYVEIWDSGFREEIKERAGKTKGCMSDADSCLLYSLIRYYKPNLCLESGTGRGKASAFILKALSHNKKGYLTTVERNKKIKIGELIPEELSSRVTFINTSIEAFIESDIKKWNFFLHDATHRLSSQLFEYNTFWDRLNPGGILTSHDTEYSTAFTKFVESKYVMDEKGLTCFKESTFGTWGNVGNFGWISKK
jgi:predicted O-methyltransferase YrrM